MALIAITRCVNILCVTACSSGTLCKEPSYLQGMFSGHFSVPPSEDGSYFIDRDSKWFGVILNYLRTHNLSVSIADMSITERHELKVEVEFYGLGSLLDLFGNDFLSSIIVSGILFVIELFVFVYLSCVHVFEHAGGNGCCFLLDSCQGGIKLSNKFKTAFTHTDTDRGWGGIVRLSRPEASPEGVLTLTIRIDGTIPAVMIGWTGDNEAASYMYYTGQRCRGVIPENSAPPEPLFGGMHELQIREFEAGFLTEVSYDPKAGTMHVRHPEAPNKAMRNPCLIFEDIPNTEPLQPMCYFGNKGVSISIID
jgi:hypothetical protein